MKLSVIFGLVAMGLPLLSTGQHAKNTPDGTETSISWNEFDGHVAEEGTDLAPTALPQKTNCITHHGTLNGGSSLVHHNQPEEPAYGDPRFFPRTTPGQVIPLGYPIAYTHGPGRTIVSGLTDASASMQLLPQGPRASCPPENQR